MCRPSRCTTAALPQRRLTTPAILAGAYPAHPAGEGMMTTVQPESTADLQTVDVNGVSLHYLEQGSGTSLVFVHGGFGSYLSWPFQLEALAPHARVVSYSQ